jgi:hypothetical protein
MNITPRMLLSDIYTLGSDVIGTYIFKDGARSPAIGILGLRDSKVTETEGCEVLIDLVPCGDYAYDASYHNMENGSYRVRIIQHRAEAYHLPALVRICASLGHFGNIKYVWDDRGTQTTPYADVLIGRTNIQLTNLAAYNSECPFDFCPQLP